MQFIYSWNAFQSRVFNFLSHEWVCSSTYLGELHNIWSIDNMEHIIIHSVIFAFYLIHWEAFKTVSNCSFRELWCNTTYNEAIFEIEILSLTLRIFKRIYIIYFKLCLSFSKKWIESWKIFFSMMNQMRCMCWFLPIFCFIIKTQIWPAV